MKLRFLGTGTSQGIPVIGCSCPVCMSTDHKDKRLRTSALLSWGDWRVNIDAGPDFRQQMLSAGVEKLDGVLMTHEHNDHMAGMDDIRPFYFRRGKDFPFYATAHVQSEIRHRFAYFFHEKPYPGVPRIHFYELEPFEDFYIGDKRFTCIPIDHGSLDVMGFLVEDFCYITDAKYIPALSMERLKGVKTLVLNALRHRSHASHLSLSEAIALGEALEVERLFLTHISHELGLHEHEQGQLPDWVNLAYDGLVIDV